MCLEAQTDRQTQTDGSNTEKPKTTDRQTERQTDTWMVLFVKGDILLNGYVPTSESWRDVRYMRLPVLVLEDACVAVLGIVAPFKLLCLWRKMHVGIYFMHANMRTQTCTYMHTHA